MKYLMSFFTVVLFMCASAQQASHTTEPVEVSFKGNSPTMLVINAPEKLEMKSRGLTTIYAKEIEIQGKVEDDEGVNVFLLNNFSIPVNADGTFSKTVEVAEGENELNFVVIDGAGDKFERTYEFMGQPAPVVASTGGLGSSSSKYYALIIGINDYDDPEMVDLDKPLQDAEDLANILVRDYTFDEENITLLKNATRAQIIDELAAIRKKVTEEDNVLIFYAGHGYYDTDSEIGYWIPSDGRRASTSNWFRNSTLTDEISAIKSKHTLLIADACFSGSIFKTRKAFSDASFAINKLYELPSRKAMTSGSLSEVPDQSAFIKYLFKRLEGNTEKYLASEQLFSSMRIAVINNSEAMPLYGTINSAGDEGGDFIFIKRD
ncbi:caspase family protein [Ekhidna sp.]|uniref:caspase family protein n=1 Tax=Ekhidna sp. TaxID=2608089 RepID=UPI003CCC17D8